MFVRSCCFVLCSLIYTAGCALAADYQTPHILEPGQTLSANVLNEIHESLAYSEKIPTRDDLLGTWECRRTVVIPPDSSYTGTSTFVQDMLYVITGTLVFTTDGSGNYTFTDQHPEILLFPMDGTVENVAYASLDGYFYHSRSIDYGSAGGISTDTMKNKIEFKGDNQFSLSNFGTIQAGSSIICDKTEVPPEIPEVTGSTVAGSSVKVTWLDTSDDETGFKVLRRDSLEGSWAEIATAGAVAGSGNTLSHEDTDLTPGTYWYRVQSVNIYGSSLGSNVIMIAVE